MARTAKKNEDTKSKIVKTIPSSETGTGVNCLTKSGDKYIISQNPLKEQFTLWKYLKDGFEKIKTSENPLEFDKIIPW